MYIANRHTLPNFNQFAAFLCYIKHCKTNTHVGESGSFRFDDQLLIRNRIWRRVRTSEARRLGGNSRTSVGISGHDGLRSIVRTWWRETCSSKQRDLGQPSIALLEWTPHVLALRASREMIGSSLRFPTSLGLWHLDFP